MAAPKNPFILGHRIRRPYFCDRYEEERRLLASIENGRNTVLISPRRMGKTTLIDVTLEEAYKDKEDEVLTFFIDILSSNSLSEFTYLFGKAIYDRLASRHHTWLGSFLATLKSLTGSFGFDPLTGLPTFNVQIGDIRQPEYMLDEIFTYIRQCDRQVVVVIDEFQQITKYPEKNAEAILRTHIQRVENATFIFAGSERTILREMFISSKRPFYNSAEIMHLDSIAEREYTEFALEMFRKYGKVLNPGAVNFIYHLFSGNTFYLQRSMNAAFADTSDEKECDEETMRRVVEGMLAANEVIYREILSRVSVSQKPVLIAIARDKIVDTPTSGSFIKRYSLPSASSVQSAIQKLLSSGIVSKEEGGYIVSDPLFRIFINRLYSLPEF